MYVARRWLAVAYDGTNAPEVMQALAGMFQLVSESDGVLTLTQTGEDRYYMTTGQVACESQIWDRPVFDAIYHVLPEATP